MRVFVTGATGFIGAPTVRALIDAGHEVTGLARTYEKAAALTAAGAAVLRGDLEDLDSLKRGAAASDGVLHLAFVHDFSKFVENGQIDKRAIEAMGEVLAGSDRPIVVTSGTLLVGPGKLATEDTPAPSMDGIPRLSEKAASTLAAQGVKASAIRLPPTVHGAGDHGFIPQIVQIARAKGVSAYVGDGQGRWPAVHRFDAAHLYRLVLEKGVKGGTYHAVAEEGVPTRRIAEVIGRRLNLPVVSKSLEEAGDHFGFLGLFFGADAPASSAKTQAELGWAWSQPDLLTDLEENYFGDGTGA
jgi:nucleoside-diphosphate-sugar epimerase